MTNTQRLMALQFVLILVLFVLVLTMFVRLDGQEGSGVGVVRRDYAIAGGGTSDSRLRLDFMNEAEELSRQLGFTEERVRELEQQAGGGSRGFSIFGSTTESRLRDLERAEEDRRPSDRYR